MKRETAKKVIAAIRQVLEGKLYLSEKLTAAFAEKFVTGQSPPDASSVSSLSDRELEVFQLLGQGCETRQIAETLNVSMKTVQAFCARIKEKLGLGSATELLREAVRWHESQQSQ
jgi:DNA-binding NarL/FixJ family response regulator